MLHESGLGRKGPPALITRIGEFLVRIGAMAPGQVEEVLRLQQTGDKRRFGEIAVERGYINNDSIKRYVDYLERQPEA
jgi:hypothetical protein